MQLHRGFEHGFKLAITSCRRDDWLSAGASRDAFLNRMNQRGLRANLKPHVDTRIHHGLDRPGKLHRLPHPLSPMGGVALPTSALTAGDGAEKWHSPFLRGEILQRFFQGLGSRLHQRMMEWMVHPHEPCENSIEL